jgi:hypothetical protein
VPLGLSLDTASHTYRLGSRVLPSVTQALSVIESFDRVPPDILERARLFGAHVHQAVDLFNRGDLDEESLDPQLSPRLGQYKKFLADTGFVVTHTEQRVANASIGYAGTLDILGRLFRSSALIDLKSGAVPKSVGPQTAAYDNALPTHLRPQKRFALQLGDDFYRLIRCKEPADFSIFLNALNKYRQQRRTACPIS